MLNYQLALMATILPLSMLRTNDKLETPNKHIGVYMTHETHPGERKSTALTHSCTVYPLVHVSHNGTFI